jgi:hypothetical protein
MTVGVKEATRRVLESGVGVSGICIYTPDTSYEYAWLPPLASVSCRAQLAWAVAKRGEICISRTMGDA